MTRRTAARALAAPTLAATAACPLAAKTLVFCSEGSPENFSPSLNTTGTSYDASRPVCDSR
jgi:dipeptide transport system substrate-binding protein